MKSIFKIYSLFIFVSCLNPSCKESVEFIEVKDNYVLAPKSEVAKKIVSETNLMVHIKGDTTYSLQDGIDVTEISYISHTGLAKKIFTFEVDLSNPNITIEASTPNNAPTFGMQRMTQQATYEDRAGHVVWGGVNADFYNTSNGTPQGILYKEGTAIKTTVSDNINTFFSILKNGRAFIGDQSEYNNVKSNIQEAVGGRVTLLSNGVLSTQTTAALEPRTAIGVSEDGSKVYILAVDGRRFHYSNGMSYEELALCMKAMGAYDAINLDGGGSTTFFVRNGLDFGPNRFEIKNWPSDNGGQERAVANGLLIINK